MEETFEKELLVKLLTNNFEQIDLKDIHRKLNFHITKFDDTYKLEIFKKINLKKEEFVEIEQEMKKIYQEMETEKIEWSNSKIEYPNLKKLWELSYQNNEINYKKEGTITYPENWNRLIERITRKYI